MARKFAPALLKRLMANRRPPVSEAELARETQIHRDTIRGWLSGRFEPTVTNLEKVAAFFGVTLDYFMVEAGEAPLDRQAAGRS